jgi:hypothetical protein
MTAPKPEPPPQVSAYPMFGTDRDGNYILGVIAKRSYVAIASGECVPAREQALLNFEPIEDPENPALILADTDLWLDKLLTDVVVLGHAWNHPRTPSFAAEVRVGRHPVKQVIAHGERRCSITTTGRLAFSSPSLVDRVPLSYAMAYGGVDLAAEARIGFPELAYAPSLPEDERDAAMAAVSPFRYGRNPAGRGFLIDDTPEAIDALALPQLEDPADMLTPDRVVVRDPWHWPLQPLPGSLDWLAHGLFPRLGWFGHAPDWDPADIDHLRPAFPEVRFGHADPSIFDLDRDIQHGTDRRALQGASLGLRFGPLDGNESITLNNLHAELPSWTVRLPGQRPRLEIDDRKGGLISLRPRLHTIVIEPDRWAVTLLWAGFAPARRPYMPEELGRMPFLADW